MTTASFQAMLGLLSKYAVQLGALLAVIALVEFALWLLGAPFRIYTYFVPPCRIVAEVSEDVVSRVSLLGDMDKEVHDPQAQQLFYEFVVSLSSEKPLGSVSAELTHLTPSDEIHTSPSSAAVSEAVPYYPLGFSEPGRSEPDHWARTITVNDPPIENPILRISILRELTVPTIAESSRIQLESTSGGCAISKSQTPEGLDLSDRARRLFELVYSLSSRGIPLKPAPPHPELGQVRVFTWARCRTPECAQATLYQMQARIGETAVQSRTRRFEQLAVEVKEILGCIDGPHREVHPDRITKFFQMCGEQVHLDASQVERLQHAFQRAGVQLELRQAIPPANPPNTEPPSN